MTEVIYRTSTWNEKQVWALDMAAKGLAEIERRHDGEVVVKATNFPALFERMVKILETPACEKVTIVEPAQIELPKNNRTFESGVIRQTLVRTGIKLQALLGYSDRKVGERLPQF